MLRFVAALTLVVATAPITGLALASPRTAPSTPARAPDPGLQAFRAWLDHEHPGYGCDEGPARFASPTVEAAYPGLRFYYVLTHTRGTEPPFPNSLSLVAAVDDSGHVVPFRPGSIESYGRGLKRLKSSKDVKLAAAAVMILASCGDRRWPYRPELFKSKRGEKGWTCTYRYDGGYSSWVRFNPKGKVVEIGGSAPPVP